MGESQITCTTPHGSSSYSVAVSEGVSSSSSLLSLSFTDGDILEENRASQMAIAKVTGRGHDGSQRDLGTGEVAMACHILCPFVSFVIQGQSCSWWMETTHYSSWMPSTERTYHPMTSLLLLITRLPVTYQVDNHVQWSQYWLKWYILQLIGDAPVQHWWWSR